MIYFKGQLRSENFYCSYVSVSNKKYIHPYLGICMNLVRLHDFCENKTLFAKWGYS